MSNDLIPEDVQEKYTVPGLERSLHLPREFSHKDRVLFAPKLVHCLKVPRSMMFRLLTTLEVMGFIERVDGGRDFRLGMAVLRLGFEYLASLELTEPGRPLFDRLRNDIHYPCNLVVRDGRSIVYVTKSVASTPFTNSVNVGTRLPAHATVLSRVLLADLSPAELRQLYPEPQLEVFSANTPCTAEELFVMIQRDREHGYVLQGGFFEANVSTITTLVLDRAGEVVAVFGTTIPSPRTEATQLDLMIDKVRAAAGELSYLLDYRPASSKVVNLFRE